MKIAEVNNAVKILLDTDIGTDIDDAICLTYLLHNPECNLLGITTVTGEAEKRAMIASSLCRHAGKEIPIYPGYSNPLRIKQKQQIAHQAKSLHKWDHDKHFPKGEAIQFLKKTIRDNPGEVVLLTIGPLTNIGALFTEGPEIPSLLKAHVLMGGFYYFNVKWRLRTEWNIMGDYHASDIVFKADTPKVRAVGIDVTSKVVLDSDEFRKRFSAKPFLPLHDYASHWFQHFTHKITFHDPLAAAVIFNDSIVEYERGDINVIMKGKGSRGLTKWKKKSDGKHEIAVSVNKENFFNEIFSKFEK
jgi:purine nucleosidase